MKTERRHELQTNELAVRLAEWIEKIKPYSKMIVGVIVLIATVFFAVGYVNNRNQEGLGAAWTDYFEAYATGDPKQFDDVSKKYPDTSPAMWALQSAGDAELAGGAGQLFRDRDAARDELQNARDAYEKIVQSTDDAMLKPRALFGLGQSLEALGEFQQAEEQYEKIVSEFDSSVVAELARHRLESLKLPATKDWYNWFAEQKPVQSPLTDPGLFKDLPNLPDQPNLNLPKPGELIPGTTIDETTDPLLPTEGSGDLGPTLFDPAGSDATKQDDRDLIDSAVPDTDLPDTDLPDTDLPDTDVPDTDVPDTDVPDTDLPDTDLPDTDVPDTDPAP